MIQIKTNKRNRLKEKHRRLTGVKVAEREGFEPPEPLGSTVFKTAAIDHSAISPGATKVELFLFLKNLIKKLFYKMLKKKGFWGCFFKSYF